MITRDMANMRHRCSMNSEDDTAHRMLEAIVQWFGTRSTAADDMLLPKEYQDELIADIIDLCKKHNIVIDDMAET